MKDAEVAKDASKTSDAEMDDVAPVVKSAEELALGELVSNSKRIYSAAANVDTRTINRVVRSTFARLRKKLNNAILRGGILYFFGDTSDLLNLLPGCSDTIPDISDESAKDTVDKSGYKESTELRVYFHLLVLVHLIDHRDMDQALKAANDLIDFYTANTHRRNLDSLSPRVFFYYARVYELNGRLSDIRGRLLALQRTVTLRHNFKGQAAILNLLLRNYLSANLIDQADKLLAKTEFKEETAGAHQLARYYYYQGRIKAVQLEYTRAHQCLVQAVRKAPQYTAKGFRATALKLQAIVQLLMGEVPERSMFRQSGIKKALVPYFELTQAVRTGNLSAFQKVVATYEPVFAEDKNLTLIQRLHHNVIKTGLRKINMSYSRISFDDICEKLKLASKEDAEFITAKAIRDGIIDAKIDHEGGFVQSMETLDIYSTNEPQFQYHKRIAYCIGIHNEAVKAMRYPENKDPESAETDEERKAREREEQEIVQQIQEQEDEEE